MRFFLLLALASPLIVSRTLFFPFITGKALFFRLMVELALLTGLINLPALLSPLKRLLRQPLFWAMAVFVALYVLTGLTGANPGLSFWSNFERGEGGWQLLHYFLFFLLTALAFSSKDDWRDLLRWQLLVATAVAFYGWLQWLDNTPAWVIDLSRPTGTLGNPSYLALYLIFNFFFGGWLIVREEKIPFKAFWTLLLLFQLFIFFQTGNRSALIALAAGLALLLLYFVWRATQSRRPQLAALGFFVLALVVASALFWTTSVRGNILLDLQPRFWTWQSALAGFLERPLLGWGAENFAIPFDKYYNPGHFGKESFFDRAHNIFIDQLMNGGLLLLLAYLAVFYFLIWPVSWISILTIVYLVNGLVLFEVLPSYLMLFLLAALAINHRLGFKEAAPVIRPIRLIGLIGPIGLIALLASAYFTLWQPLIKNLLISGAAGEIRQSMEASFNSYDSLLKFSSPIGQAEANQQLYNLTTNYLDWLGQLKGEKALSAISADIKTVIDFTDQWFRRDRRLFVGVKEIYLYAITLVKASQLTNDPIYIQRVKELLTEGEELSPTRIEFIKLRLALARLENDQAEEERLLAKAKKLRPDLTREELLEF